MKSYYSILLVICFFSSRTAYTQIPTFELKQPPKVDPWGSILRIEEDYQGFLWIAAFDGLYRYDGFSAKVYHSERKNTNSISNNWVESLYADDDSLLFIGTHGSGLDILHLPTGQFSHFRYSASDDASLTNDTVYAVNKDSEGYYWIGTNNGLNRFDLKTGKFHRFKNNTADKGSISDDQIRVIYLDSRGTIWIGTKSPFYSDGGARVGGLNRYDAKKGTFTRYMHDPSDSTTLINNEVTAIYEDSRGSFWVGTSGDGLHTMDRDKGTFIRHTYDKKHPEKISRPPVASLLASTFANDHITFINEDPHGNIIIATLFAGINIYNPETRKTTHYGPQESGIQKAFVGHPYSSKLTRAKEYFISTWSPVNLYRLKTDKENISFTYLGKYATAFQKDADGTFWIATAGGLIKKEPDGIQKFFPAPESERFFMINMKQSDSNNLWLASLGGGLLNFNKASATFTIYKHDPKDTNSLSNDSTVMVANAENNRLWVGTTVGLDLLDIQSGKFTHYPIDPRLPEVDDIKKGDNNTLWLLLKNAVIVNYNTDTRKIKRFELINSWILFVDKENTLWVGTSDGLYTLNKQTGEFDVYTDNLKSISRLRGVLDIMEDADGFFWLKGTRGLVRLNVKTKDASFHPYVNDNVPHGFAVSHLSEEGQFFSGDSAGYYSLNTRTFLKDVAVPKVLITHIMVGDDSHIFTGSDVDFRPWVAKEKLSVAYEENSFAFKVSCLDFINHDEQLVLYTLEGYENKWNRLDLLEGTASYLNVPAGTYVFRVKAMNRFGAWANREVTIVVEKPWWNTPWAYALYAISLGILMYGIFRFYKRQLLERQSEKNREIERVHAREIEKAYNNLKQTQTQLIHSEKMASLGELTAGIAHEIQNPLNFINNFAEVSGELASELTTEINAGNIESAKLISSDLNENMNKIVFHGRRADSIVKNMLQHSRHRSGGKEPTDINSLVDEYLRLSYHGLRAKDKSFNAAMQTELYPGVGMVKVVQQDISRVLLNLFSNAFYSVALKKKQLNGTYEPMVYVSTMKDGEFVRIVVRDNGLGIPQNIVDKIYQPFFTTKPTGEGTGLGLSMSYDIITKGHGGKMEVYTVDQEYAEFVISLPC